MSDSGFASLGPSLLARKGGAKPAMRPQVAPLVSDQAAVPEEALEDLGWNDMGHDDGSESAGAAIVPINADVAADDYASAHGLEGGPIVRRQQRRLEERVLADAAMTGPDALESEYAEADESDEAEADSHYREAFDSADYADEEGDEEEGDDSVYGSLTPAAPVRARPAPVAAPAPALAPTPVLAQRSPRLPAAPVARRAAFTLRLDADRHLKLRLAATMQGVSAQALVTEALDRLLAEYDDLDIIANHLKRH